MTYGRIEMQRRWAELKRIKTSSGRFQFQVLKKRHKFLSLYS